VVAEKVTLFPAGQGLDTVIVRLRNVSPTNRRRCFGLLRRIRSYEVVGGSKRRGMITLLLVTYKIYSFSILRIPDKNIPKIQPIQR
jgi:hypothetical protein